MIRPGHPPVNRGAADLCRAPANRQRCGMRPDRRLVFRIFAGVLIAGAVVHVGAVLPRVIRLAEALPAGGWWVVATYSLSALTALLACALATLLLWRASDRPAGRALTLFLGFLAVFWGSLFRFLEVEGAVDSVTVNLNYGDNWISRTAIVSVVLAAAAFARFSSLFPTPLTADRLPPVRRLVLLRRLRGALLNAWVLWPAVLALLVIAQIAPGLTHRALGIAPGAEPVGAQIPILSVATLGLSAVNYVVIPLLAILFGARNLVTSYRLADAPLKRRMLWVVAGSVAAASFMFAAIGIAIGTALVDVPSAAMGVAVILLMLAPLVFVAGATVAILSAGAIDPALAVQRSTVYGLLGALGIIAFAALENALSAAVEERLGLPGFVGAMAAGGIVALVLLPFRGPIARAVSSRLAPRA